MFFVFVGFSVGGVLSCVSCLLVFEINLLITLFAKILSHSVGFIFVFFFVVVVVLFCFLVSFTVKKLLSLIRSHFFVSFYLH